MENKEMENKARVGFSIYEMQMEVIKIHEHAKEMEKEIEKELERIKLIGKEPEVEDEDDVKDFKFKNDIVLHFVPELMMLMREYGVIRMKALNSDSYIDQNTINGFHFINEDK